MFSRAIFFSRHRFFKVYTRVAHTRPQFFVSFEESDDKPATDQAQSRLSETVWSGCPIPPFAAFRHPLTRLSDTICRGCPTPFAAAARHPLLQLTPQNSDWDRVSVATLLLCVVKHGLLYAPCFASWLVELWIVSGEILTETEIPRGYGDRGVHT